MMDGNRLKAGAARTVITPPVGVDLCGFGGRTGPSEGVHDDLRACALYLESGATRLVVLTADLIGLDHGEVAAIRKGVRALCGVPPEAVMVSCSHTHSGPVTRCIHYLGKTNEVYLDALVKRLALLAKEAMDAAVPARAGWGRASVQIGINRRERRADGQIALGENPLGAIAAHASILRVDDADGHPIACLVEHAAHAVTLGGANLLISGDWPGYAQRALEAELGGAAVALFRQGCCGNINCAQTGSFALAQVQGEELASAVLDAYAAIATDDNLVLAAATTPLRLPLLETPEEETLERQLVELQADAEAKKTHENRGFRWMAEGAAAWCQSLLEIARSGETGRTVPFEVQALRVGDGVMVGLPGEVFVEYALNIAAQSPFEHTSVSAYTNGNVGYIPDARAYPEGGYEVLTAIRYYGTTMPAPESERLILDTAANLLAQFHD